jgi:c-di-GMP-binding flagellar brake protein YcgR
VLKSEASDLPRDARRHPRYELDSALTATLRDGNTARSLRGRTLDISVAGLSALFARDLEVGASVTLDFSVPVATRPLQVVAVARNRRQYRYGFEFVELRPDQRNLIETTCRTLEVLRSNADGRRMNQE